YVTSAAYLLITIIHIDGVPDHEMIGNLLICFIIGPLKGGQRAIRKNNAPAIGDICRIAFDDENVVRRIGFFNEKAAIESCRASAKYNNLHPALLPSPFSISASRSSCARSGTVGKSTNSSHPTSS